MRYLYAVIFLVLSSCATKNPELATESDSTAAANRIANAATQDFYRKYQGSIAGQNVTAHLTMKSGKLAGTYYYDRIGIPIALSTGVPDSATGRHVLHERSGSEAQVWKVAVSGDRLQGTWVSASQTFALDLRQVAGAALAPWIRIDSMQARADMKEPKAMAGLELLLPTSNSQSLEREIIKLFPSPGSARGEKEVGAPASDLNEFWSRSREQFFGFYREATHDLKEDDLKSGTHNYVLARASEVYFDRDDFIVLGIANYEYTGGAHGNGGTNFLNYDLRNAKLWKLEDMMTVDSAKIIALLEKTARAQFDIPENVPVYPNVFLSPLRIPPNYFVTHTGITFSYWPYDVASYAQGEIQLFIPWSDIRALLKQPFIQRLPL